MPGTTDAIAAWDLSSEKTDFARRQVLIQLGVWMFLATVTMLFAAFTSAALVRRSGTDWAPIALPSILWLNTLLLAASSGLLEAGRWAARRGAPGRARAGVALAVALGLAFLVGQLTAWRSLANQGVYLPVSPHSSFFYILTGLHGLHLVAGLVVLLYMLTRLYRSSRMAGAGNSAACEWDASAGPGATFWHFLGVLWLYLFVMLSVL